MAKLRSQVEEGAEQIAKFKQTAKTKLIEMRDAKESLAAELEVSSRLSLRCLRSGLRSFPNNLRDDLADRRWTVARPVDGIGIPLGNSTGLVVAKGERVSLRVAVKHAKLYALNWQKM